METKIEQWKTIPEYEGLYMASNLGNIKSLRFGKEKILKTRQKNSGYLNVNLWKDKKSITMLVHRLVASAFYGALNVSITVNHKDFNKKNNNISNLELMSIRDNIIHAFNNKRRSEAYKKGSSNGRSKLVEEDIATIRSLKLTSTQISNIYGVSVTVISSIRNNKSWKHV